MVFADALLTEEDIRRVAEAVDAPLTVNMGYGIRERPTTPLIPAKRLEELGVAMSGPDPTDTTMLRYMLTDEVPEHGILDLSGI